jgi:ABC-type Zn uptake system ZnuABC Zn-binding protein ZnuA
MKHGVILQIIIALVVSIAGAYGVTAIKIATIEARQQGHASQMERAIEFVKTTNEKDITRIEQQTTDKLDKIDANVQWLIKEQIETRAYIRRQLQ